MSIRCVSITAALLFSVLLAEAQIEEILQPEQSVDAFALSKSQNFGLKAGDILRVTGRTSGDSAFLIASYVYRDIEAGKPDLVAVDDPEIVSAAFEWTVNQDARYYVLVQNTSATDGKYQVTVVHNSKSGNATTDAPLATVKIFYATNRLPAADVAISPYYLGQPAVDGPLTVGTCQVTIPRDHLMGEIEGPSIFRLEFTRDPAKHVFLKSISPQPDRRKFFEEVSKIANAAGKQQAFVFIHGFNVTFEDAVLRTAQMSYDLGFAGAPILYSWPSLGKLSLTAYTTDGRNADVSAQELASFLEQLTAQTGITTVHLIAHSMGNRVLTQALDQMSAGNRTKPKAHFRQIALLAPDVDASLFQQIAKRITGTADRITLYSSSRDQALMASQKLAGYARAGQSSPTPLIVKGIDTVDASSVDTSTLGIFHQYYADNRTILSDLFQLIRNTPPDARFGLTPVTVKLGDYWVFRPSIR